jgi:hypothetical protein
LCFVFFWTLAINLASEITAVAICSRVSVIVCATLIPDSTPDVHFSSYALLKLRLLRGKTLFFVNNIDRCYKLKLFFDEFGIKSCVLNSELPIQSRQHIVSQFNKGIYDYLLASDEAIQAEKKAADAARGGRKRQPKDNEYGVARGVDFREVKNVVNFDFPLSAKSYVHRVGRCVNFGSSVFCADAPRLRLRVSTWLHTLNGHTSPTHLVGLAFAPCPHARTHPSSLFFMDGVALPACLPASAQPSQVSLVFQSSDHRYSRATVHSPAAFTRAVLALAWLRLLLPPES